MTDLPGKILVDVQPYDAAERALLEKLPSWPDIAEVIQNGLAIPKEQFLVYTLFRFRDVCSLVELQRRAEARERLLTMGLDADKQSFWARATLDATEHRSEAQDIGEALGLCFMDAVYKTHEADWRRIPEGAQKTLDYVAGRSGTTLEVEAKGSFVLSRTVKSSAISNHKSGIDQKKATTTPGLPGVRLGTIAAVDRVPAGRPMLWLVDPPVVYRERSPEQIALLHRMAFLLRSLRMVNPTAPLIAALETRLIDLQHLADPFVLDGAPLAAGREMFQLLPRADLSASQSRFFSTRSVVLADRAGGVVVPSGDGHLFFAGVREGLLELAAKQDFHALITYRNEAATIERVVTAVVSRGRFKKYGFDPASRAVRPRGPGYLEVRLSGALHYSTAGLVFGWLERPDDL